MTFDQFKHTNEFLLYCDEIKCLHQRIEFILEAAETKCPSGDEHEWMYSENGLILWSLPIEEENE